MVVARREKSIRQLFHRRETVAESGLEEAGRADEREKIRKGEVQVENMQKKKEAEVEREREKRKKILKRTGKKEETRKNL